MLIKKIGWFSNFLNIKNVKKFDCGKLLRTPKYSSDEARSYYEDQVIHLLFIGYHTKLKLNYPKVNKVFEAWIKNIVFNKLEDFDVIY